MQWLSDIAYLGVKRAELASIPASEMFKTHDLRRTYISKLLDNSGALVVLRPARHPRHPITVGA